MCARPGREEHPANARALRHICLAEVKREKKMSRGCKMENGDRRMVNGSNHNNPGRDKRGELFRSVCSGGQALDQAL